MKNIYDYFTELFGANPDDTTLRKLPVESVVGRRCREIIDAGNDLIALLDPAVDTRPIVEAIEHAVMIEWRS